MVREFVELVFPSSLHFGTLLTYCLSPQAVSCRLMLHGALAVVKAGHKLLRGSVPSLLNWSV